jgi:endonuclease I
MKKHFFIPILFLGYFVYAQQAYYDDVNLSLSGIALKNELANKITSTHSNSLSYNEAREALKIIDLVPDQGTYVYLVYGFSNDLCPTSSENDNDHKRRNKSDFGGGSTCEWNREHTYPKSVGTPNLGTSGPGADAHMLRACDVQRNSQRGSKPFRDATGNSHIVNTNYWYPGDEWKGDMARMMMYMYLRYGNQCKPSNVGFGSTVSNDAFMVQLFLEWNTEDPVSDYEKNRNNYLENSSNTYGQGNRNPFIDNPYLATRIWGGPEAEDIWGIYMGIDDAVVKNKLHVFPNPLKDKLFFKGVDIEDIKQMSIYTISGNLIINIKNILTKGISVNNIPTGIYFLKIKTKKSIYINKFIKE